MAARQQGGQYRRQDTTVLVRMAPTHEQPHPQMRWEQRTGEGWADESVRAIWRVAEPINYPRADEGGAARYHEETDTVLIAHYGVLDTVCDLSRDAEHVQRDVREQVGTAGGDET